MGVYGTATGVVLCVPSAGQPGRILGLNAGDLQAYFDADGKIKWAGALGRLDANGVTIRVTTAYDDTRGYRFDNSSGDIIGITEAFYNGSDAEVTLESRSSGSSVAILYGHSGTGGNAVAARLYAKSGLISATFDTCVAADSSTYHDAHDNRIINVSDAVDDTDALNKQSADKLYAPVLHSLLSAIHGDTTAAACVRGDIITGQGASPLWTRLAKGNQYSVLGMGANEPAWSGFLLDGTAGGKVNFAVTNGKVLTLTATDDYNVTVPATGTVALATGIAGGQTVYGGTASGNNLTLSSTIHATKGKVLFGANSAYDEVNDRWGVKVLAPSSELDVGGDCEIASAGAYYLGDPTTDGSWRIIRSGNDLEFARRESGAWVTKGTVNA